MKKVFEIKEEDKILQIAWLCSAIYKNDGKVILKFAPNLKPYMLKLKEFYTSYKLVNILSLKSKYSIRLYEILKYYQNTKKKETSIIIDLKKLKKMIGATANYLSVYADFKRKVLLKSQSELIKLTDIKFYFEEIKEGRKVAKIKFVITSNERKDESNQLELKNVIEASNTDIRNL